MWFDYSYFYLFITEDLKGFKYFSFKLVKKNKKKIKELLIIYLFIYLFIFVKKH